MKLSKIIETQLTLFSQVGILEHIDYSLRFLQLQEKVVDFNRLFHETRSSRYCGVNRANFFSDLAIKMSLENFEIGESLKKDSFVTKVDGGELQFRLKNKFDDMPEALWCFPLLKDGILVARIGLNFHYSEQGVVASITNVQGKNKNGIESVNSGLGLSKYWPVESKAKKAHSEI